jgi:DNA-binding transcriptional MocR family regulator
MILFKVDHRSIVPIYQQIVQHIRVLVETAALSVGTKLPATRALAAQLGVDRSTVFRAYQELLALGYLESRPGSYTTVQDKPRTTTLERTFQNSSLHWSRISNTASQEVFETYSSYAPELDPDKHPDVLNLTTLQIDPRLFPLQEIRKCTNQAIAKEGTRMLQYGPLAGHGPLREYIAHRLQLHGISSSKEEILITNGSQHGLELILKLLSVPGSLVAIESPTYAAFIPLLRYFKVELVQIPFLQGGMDLNRLEQFMQKRKFAFIYTIPNFQNPTGFTSSQEHRERLLHLCERYSVPLVEDGFEEELKYSGNVAMPIKSMDKHHVVLYVGTFSKVLFPGLRIGWIAAHEECIQRLASLKRFSDLTSSMFTQVILTTFCKGGYYDRHLKKMHSVYRKRMSVALDSMKRHLSGVATWTEPEGGYTLWGCLKKAYRNERQFKHELLRHGVLVSPGHYYFSGRAPKKYFRLSTAGLTEDEIREGIARLGKALRHLQRSS